MAKATKTIREVLQYPPQYAQYFAENAVLFNRVVAFYFSCIQAYEGILSLKNKEALTTLEKLTHETEKSPHPIMPLAALAPDIPAYFRRAAINAALGSARFFSSSLKKWRLRKEKYEAKQLKKGKKRPFRERPPVPPRTWNKSAPFYAGLWKERSHHSIMLRVWTGSCWSWLKVGVLARDLPAGFEMGSPRLVRKGAQWWLHTPIEFFFASRRRHTRLQGDWSSDVCSSDLEI